MNLIDALKSKDYATLKTYIQGRIRDKVNAKVDAKVEEFKKSLIGHELAKNAKVDE